MHFIVSNREKNTNYDYGVSLYADHVCELYCLLKYSDSDGQKYQSFVVTDAIEEVERISLAIKLIL